MNKNTGTCCNGNDKNANYFGNNYNQKNFLNNFRSKYLIYLLSALVLGKIGHNFLHKKEKNETNINMDCYQAVPGIVNKDLLLQSCGDVYDNIIYARELKNITDVENTKVFQSCKRIRGLENVISSYAIKYNVPLDKLLGLVFVESEGQSNVGNKSLNKTWNCYGYTQLSVGVGKHYGAILRDKKKKKWVDHRDDLDISLDATCKFLVDMRNKYISRGYNDEDWSITFSSYHMGETHMYQILKMAERISGHKPQSIFDILMIDDKELAVKIMSLKDESYKYYFKLISASFVYDLFNHNRHAFRNEIQGYIDMPFTRKPSISEEWKWYKDLEYYPDSASLMNAKLTGKIVGIPDNVDGLLLDTHIGQHAKSEEYKDLMHMASKPVWGLIKLLIHHCTFDIKVTSLTRDEQYNSKYIYNNATIKKWTSHATGNVLDLGFPKDLSDKMQLKWILFRLELQGMIAFVEERNHFHININPQYFDYFTDMVYSAPTSKSTFTFGCSSSRKDKISSADNNAEFNEDKKDKDTTCSIGTHRDGIDIEYLVQNFNKKNSGGFYFIRESVSGHNKYFIYKYSIKYGGKPIHVIERFNDAFPTLKDNTLNVTDKFGNFYNQEKRFVKGDSVYIKVLMQ